MSTVPQKINDKYQFCLMDAEAKRPEGGRGVGSMRTPADKGGRGSKINKILRTSFMDGPLVKQKYFIFTYFYLYTLYINFHTFIIKIVTKNKLIMKPDSFFSRPISLSKKKFPTPSYLLLYYYQILKFLSVKYISTIYIYISTKGISNKI